MLSKMMPQVPAVSMATLSNVVPVTVLLAVDSEDGDRDGQMGCGTQLVQGGRDDRDGHLRRRPGKTAGEDAGPDTVPGFPGWLIWQPLQMEAGRTAGRNGVDGEDVSLGADEGCRERGCGGHELPGTAGSRWPQARTTDVDRRVTRPGEGSWSPHMGVKDLAWLGIPARDYAAAVRFFAQTLGLEVAFDEGTPRTGRRERRQDPAIRPRPPLLRF